ncbi:hypothetical protein U9M48_037096 [Paspalum notatum var. saurae]|uniref:Uncharacterized protein n=1 Tax=Paspalum notatum var. saurae TaxID=547442 RepID=A0AAQ3XA83_PASNO
MALPPELVDDAVAVILLCLPPDEPAHGAPRPRLPRMQALAPNPLRRGFLRRYRAFHGAPPLLGFLNTLAARGGRPVVAHLQERKVSKPGNYFAVFPFMSFYTPDSTRLRAANYHHPGGYIESLMFTETNDST